MTELVGDPCIPNTLIIPMLDDTTRTTDMSGALLLSGGKLYFMANSKLELITSA